MAWKTRGSSIEFAAAPIRQDLPGRVIARCSHHASARMSSRSAQVKPIDWRPVSGPARDRPHEEQLIERHVSVKNVTARQRVLALEVKRRNNLAMNDRIANVRRR